MNIEARNPDQGQNARQLAAAPEPVFIFDGRLPVLVWANRAAVSFLSGAGSSTSDTRDALPHLDRAMPAMVRLRALAAETLPESGRRLSLVFWTATGTRSLECDCRRASFAFAPEAIIVHAAVPDETGSAASESGPETPTKAKAVTPPRPKRRAKKARGKEPVQSATKRAAQRAAPRATANGARGAASNPPAEIVAQRVAVEPLHAPSKSAVANPSPTPPVQAPPIANGTPPAQPSSTSPAQMPADPAASRPSAASQAYVASQATAAPQVNIASQILPTTRPEAASDSFALREIARQIQSATSAQLARRAQASESATLKGAAPKPQRSLASQPDMLSQIGHEIRTPLSSILGFAEIMRDERLGPVGNPRYKSYAADIHDSAVHALSLINDLLDLARLEAGGWRFEPVELDVAASIASAVASLHPQAEKAGVMLAAPAGRPLPKLICDARALKQMLLNLLSNAIKHTDSGGAVWATAAGDDAGGLVIRVQDTGVGLSREDLASVLEPWSQTGAADRRIGGSGLGLPLTKMLAEANGGKLVLERIAGGGLAALLVFPASSTVRG